MKSHHEMVHTNQDFFCFKAHNMVVIIAASVTGILEKKNEFLCHTASSHLIGKNIDNVINFKFFYKKIYTCKYFQLEDDKIAFFWAMNIIWIVLLCGLC